MLTAETTIDKDAVHRRCVAARGRKAGAEWEICAALLEAIRAEVWLPFGMTSLFEYADRYMGLGYKAACERLRVGRQLEDLPLLSGALREGTLAWSVVREVTRVATPEKEEAWFERVQNLSMREVEDLVSRHEPGDGPDDPPSTQPRAQRMTFELTADQYALVREAIGLLKKDHGDVLTEEDALALMARAVLGGPRDEGRASYQIQLTVCDECGAGTQDARGREVAVSPEAVERAVCDSQLVRNDGHAKQGIPPATRRAIMRRDHGRCRVPGCRLAGWVDVHHVQLRSEGGTHDPANLVVLCSAHHDRVHEGRLIIQGRADADLRFLHADGSPYGTAESPALPKLYADVYSALTNLGWKQGQARDAIAQVRPHVGTDARLEDVLRKCLAAARN